MQRKRKERKFGKENATNREIDADRSAGQQGERDEERKKEREGRKGETPLKYAVTEGTRNSTLQPQQEQERSKTIAE